MNLAMPQFHPTFILPLPASHQIHLEPTAVCPSILVSACCRHLGGTCYFGQSITHFVLLTLALVTAVVAVTSQLCYNLALIGQSQVAIAYWTACMICPGLSFAFLQQLTTMQVASMSNLPTHWSV